MALEPNVVDAVTNNNFKSLGEGASFYANLAMKQAVDAEAYRTAAAQRREAAADAAHAAQLQKFVEVGVQEAVAENKVATGVDVTSQGHLLANTMSQLAATLGQIQQLIKTAQSTPPETAGK